MNYVIHRDTDDDELKHYGVKGSKWGVRRYQNEDGSYKPGAEGRYAPETSGQRHRAMKGMSDVEDGKKKSSASSSTASKMVKDTSQPSKSSGGGGGSKVDTTAIVEKVTGKSIDVKDVSEKLDKDEIKAQKAAEKKAKNASTKASSSSASSKESDFKVSQLTDKIENFFDMDDMTDEDWDQLELSDKDVDEIDDLITKYKEWRQKNTSNTKKTKRIDAFIERYTAWRSNRKSVKQSEPRELYLMHHGILGMKWGIRRYQNKDGSLTDAGKKRYLANLSRKGYESIYWDTDDGMSRKSKEKERKFMRTINSEISYAVEASYGKFSDDMDAITRSTDKETIDVINKTREHDGGDSHYLEDRSFDNYKKRYSDCGTEEQLKKAFEYVKKVNDAYDEEARFLLGQLPTHIDKLGFTDPKDNERVFKYLKNIYALYDPDGAYYV